MTDPVAPLPFDRIPGLFAARPTKTTVTVHAVPAKDVKAWVKKAPASVRAWVKESGASLRMGRTALLPKRDGTVWGGLFVRPRAANPFEYARLFAALPKGRYALEGLPDARHAEAAALGWALAAYKFDRYKSPTKQTRKLVWPQPAEGECDKDRVRRLAEATYLVRDLVNTPAADMGPAEMEATAVALAGLHGAKVAVIRGDDLLKKNYPAVHAVGRAAVKQPRLIDLTWGKASDPKVTLVGKGVTFDSGGLDIKPASGMLIMKKDMGGGAHAMALAHAIMDAKLPVRLRMLVPAVENAISGDAFRPLDVLQTRKGLTVEVGNTDAEGRLILCDALHEASMDEPRLLLDFATLTGAARVALGTELPAFFTDDDELAGAMERLGRREFDPLWRLPLHRPYLRYLESRVADTSNTASSRFGGAITAALFLSKFVDPKLTWGHFDLMAWNNDTRAGRPRGGEAMALRAAFALVESLFTEDEAADEG